MKIKYNMLLSILLCFSFLILIMPNVEAKNKNTGITLNHTKVTIVKNETLKLKVLGADSQIKWNSSDKSIAKINKNGKVTAKSKGTVKITAKVKGHKKLTCKITVEEPVGTYQLYLGVGESSKIRIYHTVLPVTWKSKNKEIATVTKNGKVVGVSPGNTIIVAKVSNTKYKCKVTVVNNNEPILD